MNSYLLIQYHSVEIARSPYCQFFLERRLLLIIDSDDYSLQHRYSLGKFGCFFLKDRGNQPMLGSGCVLERIANEALQSRVRKRERRMNSTVVNTSLTQCTVSIGRRQPRARLRYTTVVLQLTLQRRVRCSQPAVHVNGKLQPFAHFGEFR